MVKVKSSIRLLFVGTLLLAACVGMPDELPPDDGTGSAPPPCGDLGKACSSSEYCLVSSILQQDGQNLLATSDCEPLPSLPCPGGDATNDLCACLVEDAKAQNSNCSKPGTVFLCDSQTQSGATSPRLTLSCTFRF